MFHAMPPWAHRGTERGRSCGHRPELEHPCIVVIARCRRRGTGSASCAGGRRRSWVRVDPQTREGSNGDQREEPAERNHRVRVAGRRDGESTIDVNGATVVAAITKESAERLEVAEGQSVVAIVKATDVMIGIAPV
jgi:molybdopterin-binding protein